MLSDPSGKTAALLSSDARIFMAVTFVKPMGILTTSVDSDRGLQLFGPEVCYWRISARSLRTVSSAHRRLKISICAHGRFSKEIAMTLSDELSKLAELHSSGALTEDEFARAKAGLLNAQGRRAEEPA